MSFTRINDCFALYEGWRNESNTLFLLENPIFLGKDENGEPAVFILESDGLLTDVVEDRQFQGLLFHKSFEAARVEAQQIAQASGKTLQD